MSALRKPRRDLVLGDYVFYDESDTNKTLITAWLWRGGISEVQRLQTELENAGVDCEVWYEDKGTHIRVRTSRDWVSVPYGYYLVLDYDRDLFVMSPDRFDEWFPPTSYGHGMVMTDGN